MSVEPAARWPHLLPRHNPVFWLSCVLLFGIFAPDAKAGFIGPYSPNLFSLVNSGGGTSGGVSTANGFADFPDVETLILYGTNDGSGKPGNTDLTIASAGNGLFHFMYVFNTFDLPTYQYGGYIDHLGFHQLADTDGMSGSITVPVVAGEVIGFRAGGDNQSGLPGVLTITDFSAPVPEPGTLQLLLVGVAASAVLVYRRRRRV